MGGGSRLSNYLKEMKVDSPHWSPFRPRPAPPEYPGSHDLVHRLLCVPFRGELSGFLLDPGGCDAAVVAGGIGGARLSSFVVSYNLGLIRYEMALERVVVSICEKEGTAGWGTG